MHEPYGGPDALCRFVDAAHDAGLAVVLDLVHNHLGPSGDYWDRFGPLRTSAHRTPWGAAVNLDQPGSDDVRAILLGSARRWLTDFHLDGLRLDAVHALHDQRALTYLEELAASVDDLAVELGRPLALVAESDRNDPGTVLPRAAGGAGGPGLTAPGSGLGLTAQWDDDVHHALHWLTTGETQGYYADFGSAPALAHTLERAFWHDGRWSSFRGRTHGRPVDWARTDPWRFVVSVQTHDQVGNRAAGDRIAALVGPDRAAAAAAILLTLPYTPMLFMGEEWGETTPWPYFSSFPDPVLGAAVSEGRRAEFERHGWGAPDVPDPQDPATYEAARLDPAAGVAAHPLMVAWYRDLLALRRREPGLLPVSAGPDPTAGALRCRYGSEPVGPHDPRPSWVVVGRPGWRTAVNLRDVDQDVPLDVAGLAGVADAQVELAWPPGTVAGTVASTVAAPAPAPATRPVRPCGCPGTAAPSCASTRSRRRWPRSPPTRLARRRRREDRTVDLVWSLASILALVVYFLLLFRAVLDVFRSADLSAWAKGGWFAALIVVPIVPLVLYLVLRGGGVRERERAAVPRSSGDDAPA